MNLPPINAQYVIVGLGPNATSSDASIPTAARITNPNYSKPSVICHHPVSCLDYGTFSPSTLPTLSDTSQNQPPTPPSRTNMALSSPMQYQNKDTSGGITLSKASYTQHGENYNPTTTANDILILPTVPNIYLPPSSK